MSEIYAGAGKNMVPVDEYDFTQEYLSRLCGVRFIPTRKKENYKIRNYSKSTGNYISPLKQTILNSSNPIKAV